MSIEEDFHKKLLVCAREKSSDRCKPRGCLRRRSLDFPTVIEIDEDESWQAEQRRRKIDKILNQACRFRKRLVLRDMNLSRADIPLQQLKETNLGCSLVHLSLSGNRIGSIPADLVQSPPLLQILDLSRCDLDRLPDQWDLPKLRKLDLSHNNLIDFLDEVCGDTWNDDICF